LSYVWVTTLAFSIDPSRNTLWPVIILNEIKRDPIQWLPELLQIARRSDDLWREPFLLAVSYQSGEDEIIAQHIVDRLLDVPVGSSLENVAHDLLLATECVLEAKSLTIGRTLESKIAKQLFDTLIPPLLTLGELSAVDKHQHHTRPLSFDPTIADLSLTTLSFMGKRGPAGLLLATIRQHFKDYPNHLRLLARFSLEARALLTLAVVPLTEGNYQHFESTIVRWLVLRDQYRQDHITEREIDICLDIH
jgi:hypothetical protein